MFVDHTENGIHLDMRLRAEAKCDNPCGACAIVVNHVRQLADSFEQVDDAPKRGCRLQGNQLFPILSEIMTSSYRMKNAIV